MKSLSASDKTSSNSGGSDGATVLSCGHVSSDYRSTSGRQFAGQDVALFNNSERRSRTAPAYPGGLPRLRGDLGQIAGSDRPGGLTEPEPRSASGSRTVASRAVARAGARHRRDHLREWGSERLRQRRLRAIKGDDPALRVLDRQPQHPRRLLVGVEPHRVLGLNEVGQKLVPAVHEPGGLHAPTAVMGAPASGDGAGHLQRGV